MWPCTTKPVLSCWVIYSYSQKYIVWVKCIDFSFMPKIIRTLSKDHVLVQWRYFVHFLPYTSKINFWLVICIAKNFIWTTVKAIFSVFRFFCTLKFLIFKKLYLNQILSNPNKPHINGKLIYSASRWCNLKIDPYDWFCGPGSHSITEPTRREAYGSMCKLLFRNIIKHRQGQTSVNRYVEGKTQEYSREHASVIDQRTIAKGLDNRGNPGTRAIVQAGANRVRNSRQRVNPSYTGRR